VVGWIEGKFGIEFHCGLLLIKMNIFLDDAKEKIETWQWDCNNF